MISEVLDPTTGQVRRTSLRGPERGDYPQPIYRLRLDGKDISDRLAPRLVSLELTDKRGLEVDELTLTLSDHDGRLPLPPLGGTLQLELGWSNTGLVDKGSYLIAEINHNGAPDLLKLRARSADLSKSFKTQRDQSYSNTTLGEVLRILAARQGLTAAVDAILAAKPILQLDQARESDANLLTRLGEEYDAVATVKAGYLLFMPKGQGKTASGKDLPHIILSRQDGDQHQYLLTVPNDGVRAYYYDVDQGKRLEEVVGDGKNPRDLRHTYANKTQAHQAAETEWQSLQRGAATLSYHLALGCADLIPELSYTLTGIKPEIDDIIWYGGDIKHSLSADGGFVTELSGLQARQPEDLVADLVTEVPPKYSGVLAYYRDPATGKQVSLTQGDQSNPYHLRFLYASKEAALRAVEREAKKIEERQGTTKPSS